MLKQLRLKRIKNKCYVATVDVVAGEPVDVSMSMASV